MLVLIADKSLILVLYIKAYINLVFMKVILMVLLYPFMLMYCLLIEIRSCLYNKGVFKVSKTPVFSIGVGNITVGGTGKTPHIEYFIRKFLGTHTIATLSRGYGRKTKGFLPVEETLSSEKVGDEPWQFFLKFGQQVRVNVGERRVEAAEKIHLLYPHVNLLLMDDVFQHRAVQPDFSILLCDYTRPFFHDYPFPSGRLRELRKGAQRADAIIVSKCPYNMTMKERTSFMRQILKYAKDVPIAFSAFAYGEVIPVFNTATKPSRWLLVTGIARPQPLVLHLQKEKTLLEHIQYPDHHYFSEKESYEVMKAYQKLADKEAGILITEKDYARLSTVTKELWKDLPLFYIPIAVEFIEGEDLLLQNIQRAMDRRTQLSN
ncbi:MAG: lpxK [Cytophagaceae bacterium]|jgi:tetraacyldisaccharide 4'-kinase|nr:lpxK [Cytophagaceae bacterium]